PSFVPGFVPGFLPMVPFVPAFYPCFFGPWRCGTVALPYLNFCLQKWLWAEILDVPVGCVHRCFIVHVWFPNQGLEYRQAAKMGNERGGQGFGD
ncbi:MAG: hypothetical protein ACUVSQ_05515, partial [Pseudanabaenaceae cyanobacterium]